jgi:hypothetical protein
MRLVHEGLTKEILKVMAQPKSTDAINVYMVFSKV